MDIVLEPWNSFSLCGVGPPDANAASNFLKENNENFRDKDALDHLA